MWIILALFAAAALGLLLFLRSAPFGNLPRGERLQRVQASPNYRDGKFRNQSPTLQLTSDKNLFQNLIGFIFDKKERVRPRGEIPVKKTDLKHLSPDAEVVVWFGHGSYFVRTGGMNFLIDPVFYSASPVSFLNKPFQTTDSYGPNDMPRIDYLVITHDHWDHLDYRTVKELKPQVSQVICPLGVGSHFDRWGFDPESIVEMDWGEEFALNGKGRLYCLPARHFSGRGLKRDQSLWASFLIDAPHRRIFLGGDGGYGPHFAHIAERFGPIDLAILENGQYNQNWSQIHLMPDDLVQVINDLSPKEVLTVHHGKYALSKHPWDEPLENISGSMPDSVRLLTPMIGEPVNLRDSVRSFSPWWMTVD